MRGIIIRSLAAAGLTILLDQGSKWLAVLKGIVVVNPGAAFSIGVGGSTIVLWGSVVGLIGLLLWWPTAPKDDKVLLTFILAAGFSNLVDRLTFGGVRDFIHLPSFFTWFPVFNVADLILSISVGWLLLFTLFRPPHQSH